MPLQPGATFGGVLDFRPPTAQLPSGSSSSVGPGAAGGLPPPTPAGRFPVSCHDVVVLLESEELVAPECRLGNQVGREAVGFAGHGNAAAGPGDTPHVGGLQHAHEHISFTSRLLAWRRQLRGPPLPEGQLPSGPPQGSMLGQRPWRDL